MSSLTISTTVPGARQPSISARGLTTRNFAWPGFRVCENCHSETAAP